MLELTSIVLVIIAIYAAIAGFLFLYQRKLIYYPVTEDPEFEAEPISVDNRGVELHGWVLNPDQQRAVIYFGGNSELITHREAFFNEVFCDYSVYLINYRGYGRSQGEPSERGLFSDALAIFDQICPRHESVMAYGRSLGSGVAAYLAANRPLDRVILLTPYDSVANVAQRLYPIYPAAWFVKDKFDSASRAAQITIPVLLATAELDQVIPLPHSLALKERFVHNEVRYAMIMGAAHNDIVDSIAYRKLVSEFITP